MTEAHTPNPLLVTSSSPDTSPHIALHPLVILTISDFLTRSTLRNQKRPIVGAILGQQNGREITMEVAFESKSVTLDGGSVNLDEEWFADRLDQYKTVYPQLDLVGWFALSSVSGPEQRHLPIHLQIQTAYNLESAILLLFHPEMVAESSKMGGKLPLTLYEGLWVNEKESGGMEVDGGERNQSLKFREVPYSVETGEAEMISLDFVARGGGNASAIDATPRKSQAVGDQKGKETENEKESRPQTNGTTTKESSYLSSEDEDLISSLTAKSNAIKMLQSRLNLISAYLQSLPPSYLTDSTIPLDPNTSTTELNHPILRSISALLSRLPLLAPPDTAAFETESLQGRSDVELVSLLGSLTRTVRETRELSKKWSAVESGRNAARRGRGGGDGEMEGPEEHEQGNGRGGLASLMSSF